jgi:uncharacterized protein YdhG (YjbR/CyaY superfamily)
MEKQGKAVVTVDEYIKEFPKDVQTILKRIRETVRKAAPKAMERISYRMPAYFLIGNLVYFAAFKNHIGFYPGSSAIIAFKKQLAPYQWAKGSVQFPIVKPIPLDLVRRIVIYRVNENSNKQKSWKLGAMKAK